MKTKTRIAFAATILSTLVPANAAETGTVATNPAEPIGHLTAFPTVVQTGTKPTLTWDITYPGTISSGNPGGGGGTDPTDPSGGGGTSPTDPSGGGGTSPTDPSGGGGTSPTDPTTGVDVGLIKTPGEIVITKNNTYVSVQPIGTEPTACEAGEGSVSIQAEARISINGGAYQQLFFGTQADVNSAFSLYIKKHKKGDRINFAGRFVKNGSWTPLYTTLSSNYQVISLVNGDTPPTAFPLYQSVKLKSYLKPYLDSTGKIKIGPLSTIVMMELGQTNHTQPCFDYQDMVLMVTLSSGHPNNGHGNNLDGVDSSNPGKGHGGPNGQVDPSGGVDDEIR